MGNMKNKDKYSLDKLTITVTYTAIGTAEVKVSDGLNCIFADVTTPKSLHHSGQLISQSG